MGIIISILAVTVLVLVLYTYYHKKRCDTMVDQLSDAIHILKELNQPSNRRSVRFADEIAATNIIVPAVQT